MPVWLTAALRTAIQVVYGTVAEWLIAHNVGVPTSPPEWLTVALIGAVTGIFTAVIIWLEHRDESTFLGQLARGLGKLLMLGTPAPTYKLPVGTGAPK